MKKYYTRRVKGGGLHILQLITPSLVYTLMKNTSASNGEKHGWQYEKKFRKLTNL